MAVKRVLTATEVTAINKSKKQQLINDANAHIILLQQAVKYNKATEPEKQLLENLELFTIDVARIDTTDINVISPDLPKSSADALL
ncbi:hypothetical protein A9G41_00765 [Gilliamella sp. Nev5-1]|uniref:tail fiber assembly protein n=1 Tax=Gilliamella sp. Nev5-1 TaxID=3120251 RepID=UPI00082768B5|nr:tail fiber assembly protein [Gilliamella apicola]OCG68376.1 hypothetical protein A9G41_00765 [Gilliamella apicola]